MRMDLGTDMPTYYVDSLFELSQLLRERAVRADQQLDTLERNKAPARERRDAEMVRNSWLAAAEMVFDSRIPVLDEYEAAYKEAQASAANEIWHNMLKLNGNADGVWRTGKTHVVVTVLNSA
jgi:hypothetical protein